MTASPVPPIAKRVEHRREHHGDVFVDPYEWLRDKADPAVIEYLEAENAYTEQITDHLARMHDHVAYATSVAGEDSELDQGPGQPVRRDQPSYPESSAKHPPPILP